MQCLRKHLQTVERFENHGGPLDLSVELPGKTALQAAITEAAAADATKRARLELLREAVETFRSAADKADRRQYRPPEEWSDELRDDVKGLVYRLRDARDAARAAIKAVRASKAPRASTAPRSNPAEETPDTRAAESFGLRVSLDDVPMSLARAAHHNSSWSPERRAAEDRRDYVRHINHLAERLLRHVENDDDRAWVAEELAKHQKGYLTRLHALLRARSKVASAAVVGPANFPTARNRKAGDAADAKLRELVDYGQAAYRHIVKRVWPKSISSDRDDAVDALEKKIAEAEALHETMRKANRVVRSKGSPQARAQKLVMLGLSERGAEALVKAGGYAGFQLTNNKANIRRMNDRLQVLRREKATPTSKRRFGDVVVEDSVEANRIRLFFDDKPDAATRTKLKKNGFRWAPSVGAWQRHRNDNTRTTLRYVFGIDLEAPPAETEAVRPAPSSPPPGQDAPLPPRSLSERVQSFVDHSRDADAAAADFAELTAGRKGAWWSRLRRDYAEISGARGEAKHWLERLDNLRKASRRAADHDDRYDAMQAAFRRSAALSDARIAVRGIHPSKLDEAGKMADALAAPSPAADKPQKPRRTAEQKRADEALAERAHAMVSRWEQALRDAGHVQMGKRANTLTNLRILATRVAANTLAPTESRDALRADIEQTIERLDRDLHHDPDGPLVPIQRDGLRYGIKRSPGRMAGSSYSVFDHQARRVVDTPPKMGEIINEGMAWQAADAWNEAAARGSTPFDEHLEETRRRWADKAAKLADGDGPGQLGHWLRAVRSGIRATTGNDAHETARGKAIEAILVAERDRRTAERREKRKAERAAKRQASRPGTQAEHDRQRAAHNARADKALARLEALHTGPHKARLNARDLTHARYLASKEQRYHYAATEARKAADQIERILRDAEQTHADWEDARQPSPAPKASSKPKARSKPKPSSKASKPNSKTRPSPKKTGSKRKQGTARQREILCLVPGQVFTTDDVRRAACYRGTKRAENLLDRMQAAGLVVRAGGGWRKTAAPQVCSLRGPDRQTADREREPWQGAIGPAGVVYDAEGRPYPIRWRALPMSVIRASHHPDGRRVKGYPPELQARDRGAATSLEQVQRIAARLDPARLLAPSTAATDSSPIVWPGPDGEWFVVSGNGRTMALQSIDSKTRKAYLDAARAELPGVELPRGGIVVREMVGATFDQAVQLAGASQAVAAAALSPLEQARSVARGVGVRSGADLLALGPLKWTGTLRADDWQGFAAANTRWSSRLLSRLDDARRPTVAGDDHEAAMLAVDTMIGALPEDVVRGGLGDRGAEDALRGALPAIWSLEHAIEHRSGSEQAIGPEWSLMRVILDARRLYGIAGRKGISQLRRDVAKTVGQETIGFGDDELPTLGDLDRLGVALGVALLRAGRRKDPQAAAAEYLSSYISKAREAALVVGDFFAAPVRPDDVLGAIVRWTDPRPRPSS